MKKKNVLMMALSLCLVAVIAVGGTLAYLSDSDTKLVNTFEFANNIEVELWEDQPDPTGNEKITGDPETGFSYTDVVPGQTLNKAPELSVTTAVDAYVFVRVTDGENMTVGAITEGWTELQDNVWYKTVEGAEGKRELGTLFTQVTVGNVELGGTEDLGNIVIEVAAIQMDGFDTPADAYAEAEFQDA